MFDVKDGLRPRTAVLAAALALGLSGCGGGGGGGGANVRPSPTPTTTGGGDFSGGEVDVNSGTTTWSNDIGGSIDLVKGGAGTLVLAGTDTYTGGTTISTGTLQLGNGGTTGSIVGDVTDNGSLVFDRSDDVTFNGAVSGSGSLTQAGTGTLALTGIDTYTGGTTINTGTLQLGNGGTTGSIVGNVTDNTSLVFDRSDDVTFSGIVSGSGSLTQAGTGTLALTGTNTYTGGTTISAGTLQLGSGGTAGSIVGGVTDNGALVFDHSDDVTFDGVVSGSGSLAQAGTDMLALTGANTYTGGTTISTGTLQLGNGGMTGSIVGNVDDNGTLAFDRSDDVGFAGTITGNGGLTMAGNGALVLTGANAYTGATQVNAGSLYVDGDQSAATGAATVASGATLGGSGSLGGDVNVDDGATLAPGSQGAIGTLTINGNLHLSGGSILDYDFGQATAGGQLGDLINVKGNLTLAGTLNVNVVPGDELGAGIYRLINYDGTLVNSGLIMGSGSSGLLVQTGVAQQVNLVNTEGMTFSFWDGDAGPEGNNTINGGNGTWQSGNPLSNTNWTDASGAVNTFFSDGSFAVFQATSGTVTVDDSNGDINAAGMQFASNGYVIQGDTIHLVGSADDPAHSIIRVGDGTAAGAGYKATINSVLDGNSALVKTDIGTLVLGSDNTYAGGTTISGGTLQIGEGGTTGSVTGNVTDNGSLVFDRSDAMAFNGIVSGTGSLMQAGTDTLTLTGASMYTGGTTISNGTLQVGNGGTTGSIGGDVTDSSSLVFDRSDDVTFSGAVSGSGSLVQAGMGTLILAGANTYTGPTSVTASTLEISAGGTLGLTSISVVGGDQSATLKVDKGATVSGAVVMQGSGLLDNGGAIASQFIGVSAVQGLGPDDSLMIMNHDGGLIQSDSSQPGLYIPALNLGPNSDLTNSSGGVIRGYAGVATEGTVKNAGGSIVGVTNDGVDGAAVVDNSDGGSILAGVDGSLDSIISIGVKTNVTDASVSNTGGSTIGGVLGGVRLENGGTVTNADNSVISGNTAIVIGSSSAATGLVNNAGGGTVMGGTAGIDLYEGGTVINGQGSTIATTATASGDCSVTLACSIYVPAYNEFGSYGSNGSLSLTNAGTIIGKVQTGSAAVNAITLVAGGSIQGDLDVGSNAQSTLIFDGAAGTVQSYSSAVTGATTFAGKLVKNGDGTWIIDNNGLQAVVDTSINAGFLQSTQTLPGDVGVYASGDLDGVPGVSGNLSNAGNVSVRGGDSTVGGNYTQTSTGTLAVSLGSKLAITGTAILNGGTLEVTGADSGYVSNTHTDVLAATGGVSGTFTQLVKDTGVVFTATTINYGPNEVWLDTTGLNVTTAAAGNGVSYTAASMGSALRVQGAFEQLDSKITAGNLSGVSSNFLQAAGEFQQSPSLQAAQASLQSLSGQLHAASASMTFNAIDASSRALSDRFDNLLDKGTGFGTWTHNFNVGGAMARPGFDGVGYQLNGWLVGNDLQLGRSGVAGFAFGQSQGQQQLSQSFDHDNSRNTESLLYAGWANGNWYTQGHVGFGHFQQNVSRQILLGDGVQGVGSQYNGSYDVAYGESGLHFDRGQSHISPFANVEYARIGRDGFAEQGAGGFGLRSNAQVLDRWQAGLGLRASHHWDLGDHRAVDFSASAQWQRTLASRGDVFEASFVGLQQWQPLVGIGLSRYDGLVSAGLNATLSAHTALKFSYDYETGQRDTAQMLSARLNVVF